MSTSNDRYYDSKFKDYPWPGSQATDKKLTSKEIYDKLPAVYKGLKDMGYTEAYDTGNGDMLLKNKGGKWHTWDHETGGLHSKSFTTPDKCMEKTRDFYKTAMTREQLNKGVANLFKLAADAKKVEPIVKQRSLTGTHAERDKSLESFLSKNKMWKSAELSWGDVGTAVAKGVTPMAVGGGLGYLSGGFGGGTPEEIQKRRSRMGWNGAVIGGIGANINSIFNSQERMNELNSGAPISQQAQAVPNAITR